MNEIEVVVDVKQSPDSADLIVVKQKLLTSGEFHPSGSPVETRLGRENSNRLHSFLGDLKLAINRRAQPIFDTMPEPDRLAVITAVTPLLGIVSDHWPAYKVHPLKGTVSPVYFIRVHPELCVLLLPTADQGVEIVNIVRTATLDQFDLTKRNGSH